MTGIGTLARLRGGISSPWILRAWLTRAPGTLLWPLTNACRGAVALLPGWRRIRILPAGGSGRSRVVSASWLRWPRPWRLLQCLAVGLAVLGLTTPAMGQTTVILQGAPLAGQDAHIAQASSVQNYGAVPHLLSNSQNNAQRRILLRFDLSGIPAGATIQSAVLELYYQSSKVSLSESLRVHRVTRAWMEPGATWRSYDGIGNWTSEGGDFDAAVVASATVDGTVNVWKAWTVTSLVQSWMSGTFVNHGMLLESPARSGNNERRFASSENAAAALRPKLTLTYVATDLSASTKAADAATAVAGQVLTYTIVVKNTGNAVAANVAVTDAVDTARLDTIVPGQGGVLTGGTITWNSGTTPALGSVGLSPGGDVTLSFTARVISPAADGVVIANQALLSSATQTNIPSDDPSTVALDDATLVTVREPVGNLFKRILEKNGAALPDDPSNPPGVSGALSTSVVPGDVLTYALFFSNSGSRDASSFVARDGVPSWTDFVPDGFSAGRGIRLILGGIPADLTNAADADAGTFDAAATSNPDDPGPTVNGLVTVSAGTLAPGASGSIRFKVRVR